MDMSLSIGEMDDVFFCLFVCILLISVFFSFQSRFFVVVVVIYYLFVYLRYGLYNQQ